MIQRWVTVAKVMTQEGILGGSDTGRYAPGVGEGYLAIVRIVIISLPMV